MIIFASFNGVAQVKLFRKPRQGLGYFGLGVGWYPYHHIIYVFASVGVVQCKLGLSNTASSMDAYHFQTPSVILGMEPALEGICFEPSTKESNVETIWYHVTREIYLFLLRDVQAPDRVDRVSCVGFPGPGETYHIGLLINKSGRVSKPRYVLCKIVAKS